MSKPAVTETAPAKINLTLDVLGKRADGFHEVKMIMQTLDLSDTVELSPSGARLSVFTEGASLPDDESNIAFRAALAMAEVSGKSPAVAIRIIKRIPVAAGLAGGSADAAAVLRGLNRLWGLDWPLPRLEDIAARLGSDVVFCLRGGTALATGRGEKITVLPDCPSVPVVLVCPEQEVSTAWVYANYDKNKVTARPDTELAARSIARGDMTLLGACLCNVLESVTLEHFPCVFKTKELMRRLGAPALMSGSGPSVFALAETVNQAEEIAAQVKSAINTRVWVSFIRRPQSL